MRSSTFHKTELSRERLRALEQMVGNSNVNYDNAPGVYIRNNKTQDRDLLWQMNREARKNKKIGIKKSIVAFVAGVCCALFINSIINPPQLPDFEGWTKSNISEKINVSPAVNQVPEIQTQQYTVKSGDTIDSIAMRFYGVYDLAKIQEIQTANNIQDASKIQLGQVLTIPMD